MNCNTCRRSASISPYRLYVLMVLTDRDVHMFNLRKFLKLFASYVMEKQFHLSATEILLFRPDIFEQYLIDEVFYKAEVQWWWLDNVAICKKCFTNHKRRVPLR